MSKTKKFTWGDLKTFVNNLSPKVLKKEVVWWGDETGGNIIGAFELGEDYVQTDYGCEPASVQEYEPGDDPYPVAYKKGHPILSAD